MRLIRLRILTLRVQVLKYVDTLAPKYMITQTGTTPRPKYLLLLFGYMDP